MRNNWTQLEALVGHFLVLLPVRSCSKHCWTRNATTTIFFSFPRHTGGVVRLWRATALLARREDDVHADTVNVELHVQLLTDMLVGSFQVFPRPPGPSSLITLHNVTLSKRLGPQKLQTPSVPSRVEPLFCSTVSPSSTRAFQKNPWCAFRMRPGVSYPATSALFHACSALTLPNTQLPLKHRGSTDCLCLSDISYCYVGSCQMAEYRRGSFSVQPASDLPINLCPRFDTYTQQACISSPMCFVDLPPCFLQVSCLASSLSFQAPLVLAGTSEGTVFAFRLRHPSSIGGGTPGTDDSTERSVRNYASHPGDGQTELGVVVMKFQHTRRSIERVSCSREQVRFSSHRLRMV